MRERFFAIALKFNIAMLAVALGIGYVLGVDAVATLDFTWRGVWVGVLATAPVVLALLVMDRYPVGPLADLKRLAEEKLAPLVAALTPGQLLVLVASVGFAEEILFRGLVQGGLEQYLARHAGSGTATWVALVAASAVFGLCHAVTPAYAVFAALMGLYLGALWVLVPPRNLLAPVITHGLYDYLAILYLLADLRRDGQSRPPD